jgi:cell division septation protein DedD
VSDEGFREIQLNGKQLIFLFMAVTVVLVVTFLFGVLTGRGVREGAATTEIASTEVVPDPGLAPAADNAAPPPSPAPSSTSPAPAAPPEELSYAERLLRDTPPEENLKPATSEPAAAPAPVVQEPVPDRAPPPSPKASVPAPAAPAPAVPAPGVNTPRPVQPTSRPAAAAATPATDPSGPGFAVQVAAYPDRQDAERLVKQLATKGYPAFVMDPVQGAPTKLFRVRVGKYPNRNVAESVQAQLVKAEPQFSAAWIAR